MKSLLLMRHAKSDWGTPALDDFDRPLNERGVGAAPTMAHYIAANDLTPDLVMCSTALRARETWSLLAPHLGDEISVDFRDDLYNASSDDILAIIKSAPAAISRLMVLAHNPGMHELAVALAASARDPNEARRLDNNLPTAALVVLSFAANQWSAIDRGVLDRFIRPREL